jgi:putative ABC transport system permease protein
MGVFWQDVRFSLRSLAKSPGFSSVVILTLAVGIGATVAMYSVLDAALGRNLPFREPERLALGRATFNGNVNPFASFPDYLDYRDQNESFESLAALTGFTLPVTITGVEEPERLTGILVTGNLFPTLGASAHLGRTFSPEEAAPGGSLALILSYGYWQRAFGGSPDVLDRIVNVNGTPIAIVGVMPADFHFLYDVDVWLPGADGGPMTGIRRYHNWIMVGRLKQGVTLENAQAEMDLISTQLEEAYPESNRNKALQIDGLHEALVEDYRQSLYILMGAILLVLLIACGNVAGLLMARGSIRTTELAVRTAMGAQPSRLVRQLLTESAVTAALATGLGVLLAIWLQDLILGFASMELLGLQDIGVSGQMMTFALALTMVTALLFGIAPSLLGSRTRPVEDLKEGSRGTTSAGGGRLRSGLVVLQVAVSLVLLIGSGLLMKSFGELRGVDPGFRTQNILTAEIALSSSRYEDAESRIEFFRSLQERVQALPGVEAVTFASQLPIRNPGNNVAIWSPERPPATNTDANFAFQRNVWPGYFHTLDIPILAGRGFEETDDEGSPRVIVLNQVAADSIFPGENPLGQQVAVDLGADQPAMFDVIGVVGDHKLTSLAAPTRLSMFFSYLQRRSGTMQMAVGTASDPGSLVRPIQEQLWALDREIPLASAETFEDILARNVSDSRSIATVLAMFAAVALFLAALGIYGVLAYFVTRKIHEIGIRVALGATGGRVIGLVVRKGMILVAGGLVVGAVAAIWATGFLEDLLFQTDARDPLTFLGVSAFFAAVALAACLIPAWRALRVDPVDAFRSE